MFYSHTFLARKGPLSTVWIAAHLQHRLKKSHYTATDITSTVDRIMFPEAPIALRMSSHLLLGVVRIYSKKVEYLYQDCHVAMSCLKKAFASIDLNLPEGSSIAPTETITLPETFQLDALDLGENFYLEGAQDNHVRNLEDITIADQFPVETDLYVAITFDEDIMQGASLPEVSNSGGRSAESGFLLGYRDHSAVFRDPGSSNLRDMSNDMLNVDVTPMELDVDPIFRVDGSMGFSGFNSNNQMEPKTNGDLSPPEVEVFRDRVEERSGHLLVWPEHRNDITDPKSPIVQTTNEKEIFSPAVEDIPTEHSMPVEQNQELPSPAGEFHGISGNQNSYERGSLEMAILPTPQIEQPKPKSRKRKLLSDEATVLPNKFMKKALEDTCDLLRKRKNVPCSLLGVWKFTNSSRKEQIFHEPLVTGMCADLQDLFKKDYISMKAQSVISGETTPEPTVVRPPASGAVQSPPTNHDNVMEIEIMREHENDFCGNNITGFLSPTGDGCSNVVTEPMSSPSSCMPPPLSPIPEFSLPSGLESHGGTTIGTEILPTPDPSASTEPFISGRGTPLTFRDESGGAESTGLSDIPEYMNFGGEELNFLDVDNNTPAGSQGTSNVDILSVRTRAVAQYFERKFTVTPVSEDLSGDLDLNEILKGHSRKRCSRMFFETLILKSNGLIDVQQEQPYGDIILKKIPTTLKT